MPAKKRKISRSAWAAIQLFAMDVDGVLTDGALQISSDGSESKRFSVLDGMGLGRLHRAGIAIAWISGRVSGATTVRATELKIPHLIQGRSDKQAALQSLASELELRPEQCVYMGDDDIDIGAIRWAGIGVTVPTCMSLVLREADYLTQRAAGFGAVREVCEHILSAKGLSFKP